MKQKYTHTHTHRHTRLTALFPWLPGWILLKQETVSGSGISWAIWKSASRSRQITMPAPHQSVFYRPDALPATHTNSVKALKAKIHLTPIPQHGNYCQQHCRKKEKQSWTTYSLFALLCCMWNYDRSLKVWRQNTASIAECKYSWTVLQWSLCRKEAFIDSVKVHYVTVQLSTPLMDEQTSYQSIDQGFFIVA